MKQNNFKLDKETLIKHRFWFLLGLFVPMVFVVLILLWTSVANATRAAKASVDGTLTSLGSIPASPPNPSWVVDLKPRETTVGEKKKEIWENAWKSQASLLIYPKELASLEPMHFGQEISYDIRDQLINNDVFNRELEQLSKVVNPVDKDGHGAVQYLGGYQQVLLAEPKFDARPTSADVWLPLEDLWIKGGLLDIVRDCNDTVATFHNKDREEIDRIEQERTKKKNDIDRIERRLKAKDADTRYTAERREEMQQRQKTLAKEIKPLETRLKALRERHQPDRARGEIDRQVFTNRTWQLELALAEDENGRGGRVLKGKLTNLSGRRQLLGWRFHVTLADAPAVELLADGEPLGPRESLPINQSIKSLTAQGITGVRQILDWRTAPVKRIDRIVLSVLSSSRTAALTKLDEYNAFKTKKTDESGGGADQSSTGNTGNAKVGNFAQQMAETRRKMGGNISGPGGGPAQGFKGGGGGGGEALTARYSTQSDAVRRVPVAMKLVIDQDYLQDLLTAVANSKLRIQTTQMEWQHFPRGESIEPARPEEENPEVGQETGTRPAPAATAGKQPVPGNPAFGGGFGTSESQAAASDELSANVIEVEIYGIASVYERYTPNTDK